METVDFHDTHRVFKLVACINCLFEMLAVKEKSSPFIGGSL